MKLSLTITDELNEVLESERKKVGLTKNAYVVTLISQALEQKKANEKILKQFVDVLGSNPQLVDAISEATKEK